MRNLKEQISKRVGITRRYLDYLLNGEKDASVTIANKLSKATGIDRTVWNFGSRAERNREWRKFEKTNDGEN